MVNINISNKKAFLTIWNDETYTNLIYNKFNKNYMFMVLRNLFFFFQILFYLSQIPCFLFFSNLLKILQ